MQMIGIIIAIIGFILLITTFIFAYKGTYFNKVKELNMIRESGHVETHSAPEAKTNIYHKEAIRAIEKPRSMDVESRKILKEVEERGVPEDGGEEEIIEEIENYPETQKNTVKTVTPTPEEAYKKTEEPQETTDEDDATSVLPYSNANGSDEGTDILNAEEDEGTAVLGEDIDEGTAVLDSNEESTSVLTYEDKPSEDTEILKTEETFNDIEEGTSVLTADDEERYPEDNEGTVVLDEENAISDEGTSLHLEEDGDEPEDATSLLEEEPDEGTSLLENETYEDNNSGEETAILDEKDIEESGKGEGTSILEENTDEGTTILKDGPDDITSAFLDDNDDIADSDSTSILNSKDNDNTSGETEIL